VVNTIGRVPKDDALAYAKGADVLLLIDASIDNSPFLPTKLAEYIFMDRPILGITPDPGTSADVTRETETGVVYPPSDPAGIAASIEQFYEQFQEGSLGVTPVESTREQYTSKAAVGTLADIIDDLV
jgi:glycosyltransferase involved in cell wall biosynthesis